jgi:hypothetical protein
MEDKVVIEFDIVPSRPEAPLGFETKLDGKVVWSTAALTESQHVIVEVDDSQEGEHQLSWVLKGKLPEHTTVDEQGNIVKDSTVALKNVHVDGIDITPWLYRLAKYTHDCNGTSDTVTDPVYEDLGCNGEAELKFSTPLYLWILEQM